MIDNVLIIALCISVAANVAICYFYFKFSKDMLMLSKAKDLIEYDNVKYNISNKSQAKQSKVEELIDVFNDPEKVGALFEDRK